jgi:hypothetical protein
MDALNIHDVDKADTLSDGHMDYRDPLHNPLQPLLVEEYWVERF